MSTPSVFGVFPDMFMDFLENSMEHTPELAAHIHRPAFERFVKLGFPTRKNEEWKYTNTKALAQVPFKQPEGSDNPDVSLITPLLKDNEINIVFIDGHLSSAYSSLVGLQTGIVIKDLQAAFSQHGADIISLLEAKESLPGDGSNPFQYLNAAFFKSGVYIEIAKSAVIEEPVHIINITTGSEQAPTVVFPRIIIKAGVSSSVKVIESYTGKGKYLVSTSTDFILEENSHVEHLRIQNDDKESFHFGQGKAVLKANATLKSLNVCLGAALHRLDFDSKLAGSGSHLEVNGFYNVDGTRHVDNHTSIDHATPNATSSQLYKGIIGGSGRAVFNGKVLVRQIAQQTNAFQLNKNLLLSSDAEIDTKPELQIDADDVKCSHGAAVGQLNVDEIFYLQSRGITREEAVNILSRAFADDVLETNPVLAAKGRIHGLVHGSLKW